MKNYEIKVKTDVNNLEWFNTFKQRLWHDYKIHPYMQSVLIGYIKELEERIEYNTMSIPLPTFEEIDKYVKTNNLEVDSQAFFDYYQLKNWRIAGDRIADWRAVLEKWNKKAKQSQKLTPQEILKKAKNILERRRQKAEAVATKNKILAENSKKYINAVDEVMKLTFKIAKKTPTAKDFEDLTEAKKQIDNALTEIGLTAEELEPQPICKKCGDTGYLPNGKKCECLLKIMENIENEE